MRVLRNVVLVIAALLTVTGCSSSSSTAPTTTLPDTTAPDTSAPDTSAPSTTAPSTTLRENTALSNAAAHYLETMRALERTRCSVVEIITTAESAEELSANPELLGTAMAWDGFARDALAAVVVMSWPNELREAAIDVQTALTHEASTARQIVLGYTSDSSLAAGLQGMAELYNDYLWAHLVMRGKLSLAGPENC